MKKVRRINKRLLGQLLVAGAVWLIAGLALQRNGFMLAGDKPFDWPGLLFLLTSVGASIFVFSKLKSEQKHLRFHYAWYGALWLLPLIFISSSFETTHNQFAASQLADRNYCSAQLLPRVCSEDQPVTVVDQNDNRAVIPAGTTFQAGYLAMFVLYGTVGFSLYRVLRKRIKGYKREDLFQ